MRTIPGLDEARTIVASFPARANVRAAIGPRPGSIGAVYNRCTEQEAADIYIAGADDAIIRTPGWDARILKVTERMPEFIGVVGCGKMPVESMLPATCAVTRPLIDRMGYFLQPYTPFWWMDTWLFEISVHDRPHASARPGSRLRRLDENARHARSDLLGHVLR